MSQQLTLHGKSLYEMLPPLYEIEDAKNNLSLQKFVASLQSQSDVVAELIEQVRIAQDMDAAPDYILPFLARSLGWELEEIETASRRRELHEIVRFYDLKGTPLGVRLFAGLYLPTYFKRLIETYNYNFEENFRLYELLTDMTQGTRPGFNTGRWPRYGYTKLDSYVVQCEVTDENYIPGTVRSGVLKLYRRLEKHMHRASTFGYIYVRARGTSRDLPEKVWDELLGVRTFDSKVLLDEGNKLDSEDRAVHPSVAGKIYDAGYILDNVVGGEGSTLDTGTRKFDDSWYELHATLEVR